MTDRDPNLFWRPDGTSEEVARYTVEELLLAENWDLRFSAHGAAYRALGEALAVEEIPKR